MRESRGSKSSVHRLPPTNWTMTGSVSSLLKERIDLVGLPLTSLMPKISASGNDAETETARLGLATGSSTGYDDCELEKCTFDWKGVQ